MLKKRPSDYSFNFTEQERLNLKHVADYSSVQSLPEIWPSRNSDLVKPLPLKILTPSQ